MAACSLKIRRLENDYMDIDELLNIITSAKNKVLEIDFSNMLHKSMNDATKLELYDIISNSVERENELLEELRIRLIPDVEFDTLKGTVSCRIKAVREFYVF